MQTVVSFQSKMDFWVWVPLWVFGWSVGGWVLARVRAVAEGETTADRLEYGYLLWYDGGGTGLLLIFCGVNLRIFSGWVELEGLV